MEYPIITIGREIGSNGLTIGKRLSEKLHIPLYDKNLLSIAARQSGLCSDVFEHADEKESYSFLQKALRSVWSNNDNFIIDIIECRTNAPRVSHGIAFTTSCKSAHDKPSIPKGRALFENTTQVNALLDVMGNVHSLE